MATRKICWALAFMMVFGAGCAMAPGASRTTDDLKRLFVGTWEGHHMDRKTKVLRTWIQHRFEDGTYAIVFVHHTDQGVFEKRQEGTWWIKGQRFYEMAPDVMDAPDEYDFEVVSDNEIRFKSTSKDYEFTDKRVKLSDVERPMRTWFHVGALA